MSDGERRHGGDGEGDLWPRCHHVDLGQLCGVMRDVAFDGGICYILNVVLWEREREREREQWMEEAELSLIRTHGSCTFHLRCV